MSSSSHSSSAGSDSDEDFGLPVATQTLPTQTIQSLRIRDHVLVVLDYEKENYGLLRRQFLGALAMFGLLDHVDGSRAQVSSEWHLNDFAVVSWYNATVTPSTLEIVEERNDTARSLWRSLRSLFRSNRHARATYLRDEFHSFMQGDLSVVEYTSKLKQMADQLGDLGRHVKERDLVDNVLRGLDERLQHAIPHMTRGRPPSFVKLRSFLLLEEQRLARQARSAARNALIAQAQAFHASRPPPPPTAPAPHFPVALLGAGSPAPGPSGNSNRKKRKKNAPNGAGSSTGGAPHHGGAPGGSHAGCRAPAPTAPAVAGTFQAWSAPGLLGARPPAPALPHALQASYSAPAPSAPQWDQAALIAALNQLSVQPPSAPGGEWILDSGASSHMGSGSGILSSPPHPSTPSTIIVGDGSALPITTVGSASLPTNSRSLSLLDILISPSLIKNLVSVRAFTRDNSVSVEFDPYGFSIKDLATRTVLLRCVSSGDLYPFVRPHHCLTATVATDLWHQRLGHPGVATLAKASSYYKFSFNKSSSTHCDACRTGKHTRLPFSSSTNKTSFPFELCHCDLWTSPVPTLSGYLYYLVILDDFTHYAWTFPIRRKSEVHRLLTLFYAYVRTQFSRPILAFQTDNGREFDNIANRSLLESHGTRFRLSCPYTSQQNGKAERILRTLNDGVRTLLLHASMPPRWWAEALSTSTYLLNRRPCKPRLLTTPYELLHGHVPDFRHLRVFGCLCYPNIIAISPHKLAARSVACVFLGYPDERKGYRCYDPTTRRIFFSRHVTFVESVFPFKTLPNSPDDQLDLISEPPASDHVDHDPPPAWPACPSPVSPHATSPPSLAPPLSFLVALSGLIRHHSYEPPSSPRDPFCSSRRGAPSLQK